MNRHQIKVGQLVNWEPHGIKLVITVSSSWIVLEDPHPTIYPLYLAGEARIKRRWDNMVWRGGWKWITRKA